MSGLAEIIGAGFCVLIGLVFLSVAKDMAQRPWMVTEERQRQEAARRLGRRLRASPPTPTPQDPEHEG